MGFKVIIVKETDSPDNKEGWVLTGEVRKAREKNAGKRRRKRRRESERNRNLQQ